MNLTQEPTTKVTTCAECPFARHIDGNRYCCTESATAQDVVRGHWEPSTDCHSLLEQIAVKPIAPTEETPAATVRAVRAVTTATPAAVKVSMKKLMPARVSVKRIYSDISASNFDRAELEIAADTILMLGGFINPPVLKRDGDKYQVIAGHFQYHAAVLARQLNPKAGETIPAIVLNAENEVAVLAQLGILKLRVA